MQKHLNEIWKPIKNYEGLYEISNYGNVKSLAKSWIACNRISRTKEDTVFKTIINNHGYKQVRLAKNGKQKTFMISLLVWDNFGNKSRNGRILIVDHIDNDKLNNRIDNLQLLTHRENISKGFKSKNTSSEYTGVSYHKLSRKWTATIQHMGIAYHLGSFNNEDIAKTEYDRALKELNKNCKITINSPLMKKKSSKYKGVDWNKEKKKWRARLFYNNKSKHVGYFIKEIDAHKAYQKALRRIKDGQES